MLRLMGDEMLKGVYVKGIRWELKIEIVDEESNKS